MSFGLSSLRRVFHFTSSTMKMEAVDSPETSPTIYHMTWRLIAHSDNIDSRSSVLTSKRMWRSVGFYPRRPWFNVRPVHMWSVADELSVGAGFSTTNSTFTVSIVLFVYHQICMTLAIHSIVKKPFRCLHNERRYVNVDQGVIKRWRKKVRAF